MTWLVKLDGQTIFRVPTAMLASCLAKKVNDNENRAHRRPLATWGEES